MNPSTELGTEVLLPRSKEEGDDFVADFATMSGFGATEAGGVERQAATAADAQTRRWLAQWLRERGFRVKRDRIGNLFGLLELIPGAPYVLVGSHLDSQPRGGRYDGAYGVLAAAHAVDRIRRHYQSNGVSPSVNLAVVNWFNEEGSRFKPSMMGSAVYTGKLDLETALNTTDASGTTVREALSVIGELGEEDVFGTSLAPAAYVEIHIEQGKILDKQGVDIGLVTSTWAANKYEISVHGAQAHTGSTEMADRQDALYGAALAVAAVRELADRYDDRLHTSCGQLTVYPNSPVVVAREVQMHLDLRSPDDSILAEADEILRRQFAKIEVKANVQIEKRHAHTWAANFYQKEGVELARAAVNDLGLSNVEIRTRAGHDSTNMKEIVPSIMLFIPSVDGISHSELEYTHDHDLCNGVDLTAEILLRLTHGHLAEQRAQ
ncbi:M20 family metallo-hydrolase [Rhodococcus sp. NPDC057529]|uniref:M20 family metallo-hydrolase n=1 Tax=Rhodococcus sp. NPDC057529 TaxID=3346158 RepID=UPI00366AE5BE